MIHDPPWRHRSTTDFSPSFATFLKKNWLIKKLRAPFSSLCRAHVVPRTHSARKHERLEVASRCLVILKTLVDVIEVENGFFCDLHQDGRIVQNGRHSLNAHISRKFWRNQRWNRWCLSWDTAEKLLIVFLLQHIFPHMNLHWPRVFLFWIFFTGVQGDDGRFGGFDRLRVCRASRKTFRSETKKSSRPHEHIRPPLIAKKKQINPVKTPLYSFFVVLLYAVEGS